MIALFTSISCLSATLLWIALLWSIRNPERRTWPPLTPTSRTPIMGWLLTLLIFLGAVAVAVLDWNSLSLSPIFRISVGGFILITAHAWLLWGVFTLGLQKTSGAKSTITTRGPYRYSRNPQYEADIAILWGWATLSASPWVALIALFGTIALATVPRAEEPWLRDVYPDTYPNYFKRTPRFLTQKNAAVPEGRLR